MHEAIKAGRRDEFLCAENAKAALQIQTQKERFRKEFPDLAKEMDKGLGGLPGLRSLIHFTTPAIACHICGIGENSLKEKLKFCSKYQEIRYCSAAYRKIDWKVHKIRCGTGKPLSKPSLNPAMPQLECLAIDTLGHSSSTS